MGEVRVVGIRVEQPQNQPVLLLREANGDRYLPIWIGQSEAAAIALEQARLAVEEQKTARIPELEKKLKGIQRNDDLVVQSSLIFKI